MTAGGGGPVPAHLLPSAYEAAAAESAPPAAAASPPTLRLVSPGVRTWGCPECGSTDSAVIDSRPTPLGIRRRRRCTPCDARYSTLEIADPRPFLELLRAERARAVELRDLLDDFLSTFPEDLGESYG